MELPYTVVFEPPSRAELRALLRMRGHWVAAALVLLAIGITCVLFAATRADAVVAVAVAPVRVSSHPPGAAVWLDGHPQGSTPVELATEPGSHSVLLKHPNALEQQFTLNVSGKGANLDAVLWRRQPAVSRLRSALPGATLADVRLLDDGDLALSIELPPGDQLEAWRLKSNSGALEQLLPAVPAQRLAFARDGHQLAYIGAEVGPWAPGNGTGVRGSSGAERSPPNMVWLASTEAGASAAVPTAAWRPPLEPTEQLVDVSWSPDARHLLAIATRPLAGGQALSRAWLLDADSQHAEAIMSLPSHVVIGTEAWSPDGTHVAFVAHAQSINALCLLGTDASFRYVADLESSSAPPLGYPSVAWSADSQQLIFVAPHQRMPGSGFDWLSPDTTHALYVESVDQPMPAALGDTRLDQVSWRDDGELLGLWRPTADSPIHVRQTDASASGAGTDLVELPMQAGGEYAAAWDLARARLLVATRTSAGDAIEFWLARLGAEDML
ncbi:MAG: PEGA domain-containing protein [Chloroflexi bacterium]|nr:PEGA domain-containing protein [Chloroflexota bacterium]